MTRLRRGSALGLVVVAFALYCGGEPPEEPGVPAEPASSPEQAAPAASPAPAPSPEPAASPAPAPATPPASQLPIGLPELVEGAPVPEAFPDDVPPYPGAAAVGAYDGGENISMVAYETADAPETVLEALKSQYGAEGWKVEVARPEDGGAWILASKEIRSILTTIRPAGEGKTRIEVAVTQAVTQPGPGR